MMSSPRTSGASGTYVHPPEQLVRIPMVGGWLAVGADLFLLLPWFFAFFYLEALNTHHDWKPSGVHPPSVALGTLVMLLAVGGVAVYFVGIRWLLDRGTYPRFVPMGWTALALVVASIAVNVVQLSHMGFGVSSGGYASVFVGLSVVYTIHLGVLVLWLLAVTNRARYEITHPPVAPTDEVALSEEAMPLEAMAASLRVFAGFLGAVVLLSWLVLYFL